MAKQIKHNAVKQFISSVLIFTGEFYLCLFATCMGLILVLALLNEFASWVFP